MNIASESRADGDTAPSQIPPFVLAIDVGTSSVRAAIYDGGARIVANTTARREHNFETTPDGGAECDADRLYADVRAVVTEACARAESFTERIEFVAISCFWHSLMGVDAAGVAVTPLYGWADTRAHADADELRGEFDEQIAHNRTGCRFHASYWTAKLRWLQRVAPERTHAVRRWIGFGEYITSRLCGEAAASISMASATGLFNTRELRWDSELAQACGVRPDQLPPLVAGENRWMIKDAALLATDMLKGAEVLPPVGDGAANNVGTDCTDEHAVAVMIGTSAAMRVVRAGEPPAELPMSLWCYRADANRVVTGGALSDGGGLHGWMTKTLRLDEDDAIVERQLSALAPDAHGLTVLPFWYGERSTGWSPDARGAILGLTGDVRPIEILRAGMEAVAYRLAEIYEALGACGAFGGGARLIASGGAVRASGVWAQMLADVLGVEIEVSNVLEASSRGAVLLALERAGKLQAVRDAPARGTLYEPDAARHPCYVRARVRGRAAYDKVIADTQFARLIAGAPARDSA